MCVYTDSLDTSIYIYIERRQDLFERCADMLALVTEIYIYIHNTYMCNPSNKKSINFYRRKAERHVMIKMCLRTSQTSRLMSQANHHPQAQDSLMSLWLRLHRCWHRASGGPSVPAVPCTWAPLALLVRSCSSARRRPPGKKGGLTLPTLGCWCAARLGRGLIKLVYMRSKPTSWTPTRPTLIAYVIWLRA